MEFTARTTSALSSITAEYCQPDTDSRFPGGISHLHHTGTTCGRIMSASFISRLVNSMFGTSIQSIIPSGAPAQRRFNTIFAARWCIFSSRMWADNNGIACFQRDQGFKIAVEVGLVVGITAVITPTGSAFLIPYALSSSKPRRFLRSYTYCKHIRRHSGFYNFIFHNAHTGFFHRHFRQRNSALFAAVAAAFKISSTCSWE